MALASIGGVLQEGFSFCSSSLPRRTIPIFLHDFWYTLLFTNNRNVPHLTNLSPPALSTLQVGELQCSAEAGCVRLASAIETCLCIAAGQGSTSVLLARARHFSSHIYPHMYVLFDNALGRPPVWPSARMTDPPSHVIATPRLCAAPPLSTGDVEVSPPSLLCASGQQQSPHTTTRTHSQILAGLEPAARLEALFLQS